MGMCTNLESELMRDKTGTRKRLQRKMGWSSREAIGALSLLWFHSQDLAATSGTADQIADWCEVETEEEGAKLIAALICSGFLTDQGDGTYVIRGNAERIAKQQAAIQKQVVKGKARARGAKREGGRFVKSDDSTSAPPATAGENTSSGSSPAGDPPAAHQHFSISLFPGDLSSNNPSNTCKDVQDKDQGNGGGLRVVEGGKGKGDGLPEIASLPNPASRPTWRDFMALLNVYPRNPHVQGDEWKDVAKAELYLQIDNPTKFAEFRTAFLTLCQRTHNKPEADRKYIPNPLNWLQGGKWRQELAKPIAYRPCQLSGWAGREPVCHHGVGHFCFMRESFKAQQGSKSRLSTVGGRA